MNTFILLPAVFLIATHGSPAFAADEPEPPRTTGRVLVLQNERTVTGQIELVGDRYRVRRESGETLVPRTNALFLCDAMEEAFAHLRSRANLRDADERSRLARWCHLHGLRNQAVEEANAAIALQPENPKYRRLLQTYQRARQAMPDESTAVAVVAKVEPVVPPPIEVSAEHLGQFVTRVQPVLMNTCISCHGSDQAGAFKLVRGTDGGIVNRKATQQNIHAVLSQLNRDDWKSSAFLTKAVTLHGVATQPPLRGRDSPAFHNLEEWVKSVAGRSSKPSASDIQPAAAVSEVGVPSRPAIPVDPGTAAPKEPKPPIPADPFDPVLFNGKKPDTPNK